MRVPPDKRLSRPGQFILIGLIALTLIVIMRNAWVGDDAYISFRTVDNFVDGYGLRWNVAERVQGFSNPLWVLMMSLAHVFTGDVYYTSIALSVICGALTLLIIGFRLSRSTAGGVLAITILLCSKAFIDYSTSGLENPLTFLLFVSFASVFWSREWNERTLLLLSLVASLSVLNRMDTILLYVPPLAIVVFSLRTWRAVRSVIVGFAPFICWEFFSIIYYGFPFPNTYYAKLHTGIPAGDLVRQGLRYFTDSLARDPLTLIVILGSAILVLYKRERKSLSLTLGVLFYLAYVLRIGGDFMSGRFFAITLVATVIPIARISFTSGVWPWAVPVAVTLAIGLSSAAPPLFSGQGYGSDPESRAVGADGIVDERAFWYQQSGFLVQSSSEPSPRNWGVEGTKVRDARGGLIEMFVVGAVGFEAGPNIHIIDQHGLTEPLLARLPMENQTDWRIGHYLRTSPPGYRETLMKNTNLIEDPGIAQFWNKLRLITREPLFTWERFKAIWEMNFASADSRPRT